MVNGQYISSSRAHRAKKHFLLPLFICVFHLSVQSTVDKGLCKGCLRTRCSSSSSSIFFEVSQRCCKQQLSNEFSLKQQRFHLFKATLNQEVCVLLFCFCENVCSKFVSFFNLLNWISICQEKVGKDRNISFGPL